MQLIGLNLRKEIELTRKLRHDLYSGADLPHHFHANKNLFLMALWVRGMYYGARRRFVRSRYDHHRRLLEGLMQDAGIQ